MTRDKGGSGRTGRMRWVLCGILGLAGLWLGGCSAVHYQSVSGDGSYTTAEGWSVGRQLDLSASVAADKATLKTKSDISEQWAPVMDVFGQAVGRGIAAGLAKTATGGLAP